MSLTVDKTTTSGTFSIEEGKEYEVENNVWLIGDDKEVLVIDAPHQAEPIIDLIGDRRVVAIFCTHGHNDHLTVAPLLAEKYNAPIYLHSADDMLWKDVHPNHSYLPLDDMSTIHVGGSPLRILYTPGHSPGGVSLYAPEQGILFGGDTLFKGGPGSTSFPFSDFDTIINSIRTHILTLPPETVVHTGHGDSTTVGEEAPHLDEWIERGH